MLQIKNISKKYVVGDMTQMALNDISFNLRDNEFVAILGPSGSGKTTLLNVIGGLDRYDSGDLIINGISTKKYKDRDWDSYRNHTIGFVFQSYNLIPHQSILVNVELALTISGVSKGERKKRATEALRQVGLIDHINKRPNQLSGGQMQRVAIARALINDPDILLADEPTGALDSETSVHVMELLKEVAKDRLVVMVTHNPELAEEYANRIIRLVDGKISGDTNPYAVKEGSVPPPKHENMGKASMSFMTALSLSFNNLRTKKGRTLLTAFAGSIGIIGIALILSFSTGVNTYIENLQKDTMNSYPITIDAQSLDLSGLLNGGREMQNIGDVDHELDGVYSNVATVKMASSMTSNIKENNLSDFKAYLDNPDSEIHKYVGSSGIIYSYDTKFNVYARDPGETLINTNGVSLSQNSSSFPMMGAMGGASGMPSIISGGGNFTQMMPSKDGALVSAAVTDSYDILYGNWPQSYDEVVLVLDGKNEISLLTLYELGLLNSSEYNDLMKKLINGEDVSVEAQKWSYEEAIAQTFYMLPESDRYIENPNGTFSYVESDERSLAEILDKAINLKIVGVVRATEDAAVSIPGTIGYTKALTDYIIERTQNSPVVIAQEQSPDINVINGLSFSPSDDEAKINDTIAYLSEISAEEKAEMYIGMVRAMSQGDNAGLEQALAMSDEELSAMLDMALKDATPEMLLMIYDNYISTGTYDNNMSAFGFVSLDAPSSVSIYADSFEGKDEISSCIDDYNAGVDDESKITYTDYVALLMSSITTIINVISYVLIAFVSVSLIVSSVMIGIITFISVLERTKEIGILRAIGASKSNISQVFNAETFIVGLFSGVIGIGITLLLLIPTNAIIHALTGESSINAILPTSGAIILVVLSVVLTLIAGLIPSRKAAKKDPVTALRTE